MSVEDLYSMEIDAISKIINSYTVDLFIQSYCEQLKKYKLPEDYIKIKEIINRLVKWYENNIEQIRSSRFVMNKHEHEKSNELLIKLYNLLDICMTD